MPSLTGEFDANTYLNGRSAGDFAIQLSAFFMRGAFDYPIQANLETKFFFSSYNDTDQESHESSYPVDVDLGMICKVADTRIDAWISSLCDCIPRYLLVYALYRRTCSQPSPSAPLAAFSSLQRRP